MVNHMSISTILKQRRKDLGLTLAEVAKRVGVSEATVQRWESGNIKNLRHERIGALSEVLEVSPSVLMGWEAQEAVQKRFMESEIVKQVLAQSTEEAKARDEWMCTIGDFYADLNDLGRQIAIERVEELTYNPKYQKKPSKED